MDPLTAYNAALDASDYGAATAALADLEAEEVPPSQVVCLYSGGLSSHLAAKRAVERWGTERVTLLFTDTRQEDDDLYRFLEDGSKALGAKLVRIDSGLNIFELARRERCLPSNRMPFCSRILKAERGDKWVKHHAPGALLVVGLTWDEQNRIARFKANKVGHSVWAPVAEPPYPNRDMLLAELARDGLRPPRLYARGYAHNNCGGGCARAGQASWVHLLNDNPALYDEWEVFEEGMRDDLGKDVSILTDKTGGSSRPLPLRELRVRATTDDYDKTEWGGCGCFVDPI